MKRQKTIEPKLGFYRALSNWCGEDPLISFIFIMGTTSLIISAYDYLRPFPRHGVREVIRKHPDYKPPKE